jgi:hemoglobin/transferrin/lactoferrin receptor protein
MRKIIICCSVFVIVHFTAEGQIEALQKEDTIVRLLDEIVLTAQRKKQKNLFVPYSVSAVSKNYLHEFNPRTTSEALMGTNGVFVQKSNHGE